MKKRSRSGFVMLGLVCFVLYAFSNMISARADEGSGASVRPVDNVGIVFVETALQNIEISDKLILVSESYPLPDNVQFPLVPAVGRVPLANGSILVEEETLIYLEQMMEAAKRDGMQPVVTSGYRSRDEQALLYEQAENRRFVARPGESEHELGLAADIYAQSRAGNKKLHDWLAVHAHEYGFILRYPPEKEEITGIGYEPWHYRYVGVPHAGFMYHKELVLEEYIGLLGDGRMYLLEGAGYACLVYRAVPEGGMIPVPADFAYTVSADGSDGFIVAIDLNS